MILIAVRFILGRPNVVPLREIILFELLRLLVRALHVQSAGLAVSVVDVPEPSFKFSDFSVRNVGPNFKRRKMCP
jgi:hypothetical protein